MKTTTTLRLLLLFTLAAGTASALRAHALWLDRIGGQDVGFRYGDPGVKLETSPGALDRYLTLQAWTPATEGKPVLFPVAAKSDHLLFTGAKAGDIVLAENHAAPVSQRGDQPPRKSFLYLRWQPVTATAAAPGLTLDLVREAGSLRVYFRGQPLAGAEVVFHGPDEKDETYTTDADGRIAVATPPSGLVIFTVGHREPQIGFHHGQRYEVASHYTTLSWQQP